MRTNKELVKALREAGIANATLLDVFEAMKEPTESLPGESSPHIPAEQVDNGVTPQPGREEAGEAIHLDDTIPGPGRQKSIDPDVEEDILDALGLSKEERRDGLYVIYESNDDHDPYLLPDLGKDPAGFLSELIHSKVMEERKEAMEARDKIAAIGSQLAGIFGVEVFAGNDKTWTWAYRRKEGNSTKTFYAPDYTKDPVGFAWAAFNQINMAQPDSEAPLRRAIVQFFGLEMDREIDAIGLPVSLALYVNNQSESIALPDIDKNPIAFIREAMIMKGVKIEGGNNG